MKVKKSPVVYWTSEWILTGQIEIYSDKDGKKQERPIRKLEGKRNPNWRGNK